jgi:hypothetical protein
MVFASLISVGRDHIGHAEKRRRVDGSAVHAVVVIGSVFVLEPASANYHRVDGEPVHPTGHL